MNEISEKFLGKAERSIQAAQRERDAGDLELGASRAYYALFYVAEVLLNEKSLSFRKHGGVHGAFGEYFVKASLFDQKYHRWILEAFNKRITSDYGIEPSVSLEEVTQMIQRACEFLEVARRYLLKPS